MYINWDSDIYINGVEEPTYGNFGGLNYSNGSYLNGGPVDSLDALFQQHDQGVISDHELLTNMVNLSDSQLTTGGDTEAALYAGFAELTMIGKLVAEGDHLSFRELIHDVSDAYHNIQIGLAGLTPAETSSLEHWLAQTGGTLFV